ncbi:hypothetical protein CAEBREN_02266 [Caenorhabditis brenneri]|uniref:F-box associated domain-containing protein n=1 Tax=Caenorhabditis brenneri TaxID=135651 RepID=G0NKT9_CAEBE|nr:hypothetical protein CAEBREN_02266 [Caenorhabditis brenneri]
MSSHNLRRCLEIKKLHATKLTWSFYTVCLSGSIIDVIKVKIEFANPEYYVEFNFGDTTSQELFSKMKVNGEKFLIYRKDYKFTLMNDNGTPSKAEGMEKMCNYLLKILYVKDFALMHTTPLRHFNVFDSFIWRIATEFSSVRVITRGTDIYKKHEVEAFFNNVKVKDTLYLNIEVDKPYLSTDVTLNCHGEVHIPSCDWLTVESLMKTKCKNCTIAFPLNASIPSVVNLVNRWRNGQAFGDIEELKLTFPEINVIKGLKEVDILETVATYTGRHTNLYNRVVKRKTDERFANININNRELRIVVSKEAENANELIDENDDILEI